MHPLLFAAAVVPSLLLILYFYARDRNREPPLVLLATFGLGLVAAVVSFLLGQLLLPWIGHMYPVRLRAATFAWGAAGILEEITKFAVLFLFASRRKAFDEPMDGIVYGAVASLGFATLENIGYVLQGAWAAAILRAVSAVPLHACLGGIMGYFVGQAKFSGKAKWPYLVAAYFIPVFLHGLYDYGYFINFFYATMKQPSAFEYQEAHITVFLSLATLLGMVVGTVFLVRSSRRQQNLVLAIIPQEASVPALILQKIDQKIKWRLRLHQGLLAVGALVASAGSIVTFLLLAGVYTTHAESPSRDWMLDIATVFAMGILPTTLGVFLFFASFTRLRRAKT